MKPRLQRFRAHLHFLRKPIWEFFPVLLIFSLLVVLAGIVFWIQYEPENPDADIPDRLTFLRSLYIAYCLIFMEHLLPWPKHFLSQMFYVILPPLGLVVFLDALVRFGYHVVRRDENGKDWVTGMAKSMKEHVILCGLGKLGYRVLQQLIRMDEQVIVLEKDPQCPHLEFARSNGMTVLIGSGREPGIFETLNVKDAKSIILATDDDLANLEMALDARKIRSDIRVVLRMFDQELASKIGESFEIHLSFSTSELAAPLFATSASDRTIVNSFYIGEELLVVAEVTINPKSELIGRKIRDIDRDNHIFFLSHARDGKSTFHPSGATEFKALDRFTLQTRPESLKLFHKWNQDEYLT